MVYDRMHSGKSFFIPRDGYAFHIAPGAWLKGAIAPEERNRIAIHGLDVLAGRSLVRRPFAPHRGKTSVIQCADRRDVTFDVCHEANRRGHRFFRRIGG